MVKKVNTKPATLLPERWNNKLTLHTHILKSELVSENIIACVSTFEPIGTRTTEIDLET